MFPTVPIERYIRLSFSEKTDELAHIRVAEVVAARYKFSNQSGNGLREILQPNLNFEKARITCFIEIVREACKDANRIVDNEVRAYILAEVQKLCVSARRHVPHVIGTALNQAGNSSPAGSLEAFVSEFDTQILRFEAEIRRELKIEELRENVRKSAASPVGHVPIPSPSISAIVNDHKRSWYRGLSTEHFNVVIGAILVVVAVLTMAVMVLLPEIRIAIGLDPTLTLDPSDHRQPPKPPPLWDARRSPKPILPVAPIQKPGAPHVNSAPNGIINDGGTMINPTVNNFVPLPRKFSVEQRRQLRNLLSENIKGNVKISCTLGDLEGCGFAREILSVLLESGWTVFHNDVGQSPYSLVGLNIHLTEITSQSINIQRAFESIGMPLTRTSVWTMPTSTLEILVGTKPPS